MPNILFNMDIYCHRKSYLYIIFLFPPHIITPTDYNKFVNIFVSEINI